MNEPDSWPSIESPQARVYKVRKDDGIASILEAMGRPVDWDNLWDLVLENPQKSTRYVNGFPIFADLIEGEHLYVPPDWYDTWGYFGLGGPPGCAAVAVANTPAPGTVGAGIAPAVGGAAEQPFSTSVAWPLLPVAVQVVGAWGVAAIAVVPGQGAAVLGVWTQGVELPESQWHAFQNPNGSWGVVSSGLQCAFLLEAVPNDTSPIAWLIANLNAGNFLTRNLDGTLTQGTGSAPIIVLNVNGNGANIGDLSANIVPSAFALPAGAVTRLATKPGLMLSPSLVHALAAKLAGKPSCPKGYAMRNGRCTKIGSEPLPKLQGSHNNRGSSSSSGGALAGPDDGPVGSPASFLFSTARTWPTKPLAVLTIAQQWVFPILNVAPAGATPGYFMLGTGIAPGSALPAALWFAVPSPNGQWGVLARAMIYAFDASGMPNATPAEIAAAAAALWSKFPNVGGTTAIPPLVLLGESAMRETGVVYYSGDISLFVNPAAPAYNPKCPAGQQMQNGRCTRITGGKRLAGSAGNAAGGALQGIPKAFYEVGPNEGTSAALRAYGRPLERDQLNALLAANPHKTLHYDGDDANFAELAEGELLYVPDQWAIDYGGWGQLSGIGLGEGVFRDANWNFDNCSYTLHADDLIADLATLYGVSVHDINILNGTFTNASGDQQDGQEDPSVYGASAGNIINMPAHACDVAKGLSPGPRPPACPPGQGDDGTGHCAPGFVNPPSPQKPAPPPSSNTGTIVAVGLGLLAVAGTAVALGSKKKPKAAAHAA